MKNNTEFVAYEYKNITVKRDSVTIYTDCLSNFGWEMVDEHEHGFHPASSNVTHIHTHIVHAATSAYAGAGHSDEIEMVALKFKRNRRINNKLELDRLERQCADALASIGGLERKNSAYTMGISLGAGLGGTVLLALAVYSFISSNIIAGALLAALGVAGWGIGFFANHKVGRKRSVKSAPTIQAQLELLYSICEQAHTLLAS